MIVRTSAYVHQENPYSLDSLTKWPRFQESLLDLHSEMFPMESGYWTKFEAWTVEPSDQIPHGIRYSLTLHDPQNRRVLRCDNAHATKPKRAGLRAKRTVWDHKHEKNTCETTILRALASYWRIFGGTLIAF